MSHTPPLGHCRAQHHALTYYSTGASPMVIPETVLSEAQEYDWAACYDEVERWHTPGPESVHEEEKGTKTPVRVYTGGGESEGARLWALKGVRDGVCTGCGGQRVALPS